MKFAEQTIVLILAGIIGVVANSVGHKASVVDSLVGLALLIVITMIGQAVASLGPKKIPNVFWLSLIALLSTSAINPAGKYLATLMNKVDFMAIATVILAYAGLSIGKDMKIFRRIGWRMVVVALVVYTGTFVFATVIAQIVLKAQGQI